ncbi:CCR4-NOT transcription complex subunit 1 [Armadillidium nasatum]|uniref:CCR4-NOT transcription complex subunit 1 n=1 Tax=Armadillidium nasatum TaxID=96803 RepID=A0A5N5T8M5_9CRUS|nr:CCR4-NOT transcription complex subunit 1 [Armadillidium nasatum]
MVYKTKKLSELFGAEAEQHIYKVVLGLLEKSGVEWSNTASVSVISDSKLITTGSNGYSNSNNSVSIISKGNKKEENNFSLSSSNITVLVLLIQQLATFIPIERFATGFASAIINFFTSLGSKTFSEASIAGVLKTFKFSVKQEVIICIHLLQCTNKDLNKNIFLFLKAKLPDFIRSCVQKGNNGGGVGGGKEPPNPTSELLYWVFVELQFVAEESLSVDWTEATQTLKKEFPRSKVPLVLLPFLYPEANPLMEKLTVEPFTNMAKYLVNSEQPLYGSLSDYILELGCNFCNTLEECRANLANIGSDNITNATVAKVLGIMVKRQNGIQSEQNINDPTSLWMDSKDKIVGPPGRSQSGLSNETGISKPVWIGSVRASWNMECRKFHERVLMQGQNVRPEMFPVDCFYRPWKNGDEQLHLIEQILNNPDIFSFADYPFRSVTTEGLKALPELDNKAVATWRSLELIELLLKLADGGHYAYVKELFKFPVQHCPDILILGLVQKDSTTVKQIVMVAMAEWYMVLENDQTRLAKIFDVAQDLKALSMLLNAQPFSFVIDLACLAYRREYLNLEKWLTGKIRDHGEIFVSNCVKFLQRRCPQLVGGKEDLLPKSTQLPPETVSTMLACLQSCALNLSQDLTDQILSMFQNSLITRQRPIGALGFSTQGDGLGGMGGGIASSLSNLALGSSAGASIFPPVSSSMGLGLSSLGSSGAAPSSPARPSLPPTVPPPSSQSSLSTLLPSLQLSGPPPHPAVGSQLSNLPTTTIISPSTLPASLRSQSVQPSLAQQRQTELLSNLAVDIGQIFELPPFISKEVEDEANSYFQRIYNPPPPPALSIEEILEKLKKFHESADKREREVYSCMLKNLYIALGVALRYVVEALQKPHGSKMYYFGIVALDKFKGRLKDYPRYCHHLMAIEHFNEFPPHLIEYIKYGTSSQEPPNRPTGPVLPPSMNISPSTQVVVSSTIVTPNAPPTVSVVKTQTTSITATTNAVTSRSQTLPAGSGKCEELKEIVSEEYWPWIAQYLVMKRVSIENNFHTFVLLRADKSEANFSDKSLLKNLGHWLGMLTLAKNRPILHSDIDVKSLLIEAYKKGSQEMQYVVPFVAKILESCAKSRVFKPPNPWTMAIMNLLAELHREQDMKLHLKFEIEVLCNKLELNVKNLKPGNTLKNPEKLAKLKPQLSQPSGKRADSTPIFSAIPGDGGISTQSSSAGATPTPPALPTVHSTTPTQIQPMPHVASEPRFVYNEISLSSIRCFDAHITVNAPQIGNFETSTQLKQLVRHAVELAVQDLITVVMERSVKVAITTTEHIIKKDFALDPDETRMRAATHHIVRNLTAAMAMITSRDHLQASISKGIKQGILSGFNRKTSQQQIEQVDQLANAIAQENIGIASAFIQKTAAEKAVLEMDKRFAPEYEARKVARSEGRRYCDARALAYQVERMPEPIRLKVGRITPQQTAVYEEFARNIPGFVPIVDDDSPLINKPVPIASTFTQNDEAAAFIMLTERITPELETVIQAVTTLAPNSPCINMLHNLAEAILLFRSNRDASSAQLLIKRAVENLLEGVRELPTESDLGQVAMRFRDIHIILLKALADARTYGQAWTSKCLTKFWIESREEVRYNLEVIDWFIRSNLLNIQLFDDYLQRLIDEPRMTPSYTPLVFIMQVIQVYFIDENQNSILSESDLPLTIESLFRMCQSRQLPEGLLNIVDALRMKFDMNNGGNTSTDRLSICSGSSNVLTSSLVNSLARGVTGMPVTSSHHFHSGVTQARDFHDPQGLQEKTDALLRQWIQMYHAPNAGHGSATAFQHFVKDMDLHGILKTDEVITRFFRICITMCRDLCIRSILEAGSASSPTYVRNKCFPNLDAFVRLISLLVKQSGEPSNPTAKINLLNKVLGLICGIMLHDIESHGNEFHQMPYHRILIMLFLELNAPETVLESINLPVLMAFTQTLHLLRPSKCSGFAYAWLEIVSHRVFIGRMLAITPQQKGWSMYSMLLSDLFKFLAPFLRNVELSKPFTMLYKGTLRVLLVLLHDFPEFLCEYHYAFCDVIPPNCIQMRNLILSAYPRNMRLPDPFMPNLKVDRLAEITVSPKIHTNVGALIQPAELKKNLDAYLKNRTNVTFLSELRSYLQVSNEPGVRYNMSVMNALVLYVGMQAIAQIQGKGLTPSMPTIAHSAHMDIFENLAVDLDTEGRYLFLIAIANQLRYPNSHTHYFSCTLLYLFTEANTEAIQEQITRVLLERLIGNRPQPWGLLITFIELIKNPSFKFWSHDFVKCAPEIEKIFESVARSCMVPKVSQSERE